MDIPKAVLNKVDYSDNDDVDEDYEQDSDVQVLDDLSHTDKKMSLESDQDAPENEFEDIKDDDYADEDDDQY